MANPSDQSRAQRRFLEDVEFAVRAANREILARALPNLDKESFYRFAVAGARKRADYLNAVLTMDWEHAEQKLEALRRKREIFEEAIMAFEALERTIERGYVDIAAPDGKPPGG